MIKNYSLRYIYGPVLSWRLGKSLGIDLLSQKAKKCNFNCVYCQIGDTVNYCNKRQIFVSTEDIMDEIKKIPSVKIDYITFSGRGDPTLALNLKDVIYKIRSIRKEPIAVITNAALLHEQDVLEALLASDMVMAKCDVFSQEFLEKINKPALDIRFSIIFEGLKKFSAKYKGIFALQLMFVESNKHTAKDMVKIVEEINPDEVHINTPLRPCGVKPVSKKEIEDIKKHFNALKNKNIKAITVYEREHRRINPISEEATLIRRGKEV